MKRRIIAVVLLALLCLGIAGCGKEAEAETVPEPQETDDTTYEVSFELLNGDTIESAGVKHGEPMPDISNNKIPKYKDYLFAGFYTAKCGTGERYYDEKLKALKDFDVNKDLVLYAKWIDRSSLQIAVDESNFEDFFSIDVSGTENTDFFHKEKREIEFTLSVKPRINPDYTLIGTVEAKLYIDVQIYRSYSGFEVDKDRYLFPVLSLSRENGFTGSVTSSKPTTILDYNEGLKFTYTAGCSYVSGSVEDNHPDYDAITGENVIPPSIITSYDEPAGEIEVKTDYSQFSDDEAVIEYMKAIDGTGSFNLIGEEPGIGTLKLGEITYNCTSDSGARKGMYDYTMSEESAPCGILPEQGVYISYSSFLSNSDGQNNFVYYAQNLYKASDAGSVEFLRAFYDYTSACLGEATSCYLYDYDSQKNLTDEELEKWFDGEYDGFDGDSVEFVYRLGHYVAYMSYDPIGIIRIIIRV